MIKLIGTYKDLMRLLEEACENGYGDMPAQYAIEFWLRRN